METTRMDKQRLVLKVWKSKPTLEGAGVHLKRAFGFYEVKELDPFLLLDDFHSDRPSDYIAGFPWHPHRGIETVTYMLSGRVKHKDSLGNGGEIGPGDVQWMTAGSGIIHEEMPQRTEGMLAGFQLWANLPSSQKMMNPRYRGIESTDIPEAVLDSGAKVKVICGEAGGVVGPVKEIVTDPEYLDVTVPSETLFTHSIKKGYTGFAYVIEGKGHFDKKASSLIEPESLVLFGDGAEVQIRSAGQPLRFLLVSGKPLKEPVAWSGPIVMNTEEELALAFEEYRNGTFLKHR
jgi:redox-sensitive bicupin YhaK (pirin superfamily)